MTAISMGLERRFGLAGRVRYMHLFGLLAVLVPSSFAQLAKAGDWRVMQDVTSGTLAAQERFLVSSDAFVQEGGRQVLVTYWLADKPDRYVVRCFDIMGADMAPQVAYCEVSTR